MPELPEVQTVVSTLQRSVRGLRIAAAKLLRSDVLEPAGFGLEAALVGRGIAEVQRRGKKIVIELDDGNRVAIHLGMSGRLTVEKPEEPVKKHTHFILELVEKSGGKSGAKQVRFVDPRRFGGIFWLGTETAADENLGPEPLTLKPAQLARGLAKTSRAIKTALLDQKLIAGIGNIYADEALFAAGIDPRVPANKLGGEQIAKLNRGIKRVLRRAINHRGSTLRDYRDADGEPGNYQKLHLVYGREGEACAVCGEPIQRIVLGGRSTHFCGRCQKR